jgi:methylated-DNA-[protein]-cysteine S-methyltransferase
MAIRTPLGDIYTSQPDSKLGCVSYEPIESGNASTQTEEQLQEYFSGNRVNFDLRVFPEGTLFQKQVWEEMQKIPFGETATYAELAKRVGRPEAWRAVANACGKNPIVIVIPCHRVVGSYGKLGGYSGGLERKQWLLQHEAAVLSRISRK